MCAKKRYSVYIGNARSQEYSRYHGSTSNSGIEQKTTNSLKMMQNRKPQKLGVLTIIFSGLGLQFVSASWYALSLTCMKMNMLVISEIWDLYTTGNQKPEITVIINIWTLGSSCHYHSNGDFLNFPDLVKCLIHLIIF